MSTVASALFRFTRPVWGLCNAELAHSLALQALRISQPFFGALAPNAEQRPIRCFGLEFGSPLGLAAGCDKNGDFIDALGAVGFGFVEIGTVTPRPQAGNSKPRLFRVPRDLAVINRMGFNNKGVDYVVERLRRRTFKGICGVNIGKNASTPNEAAQADYIACFRKIYPYADYVTVNISSPNTPGLRDLQSGEGIKHIAGALLEERVRLEREHGTRVPLLVKIAPDLGDDDIREIGGAITALALDGVVATNTTTDRTVLTSPAPAGATGGISGQPLLARSLYVVKGMRAALGRDIPIIGVGGITDGAAAVDMMRAGANLLQVYTGFVYRGPALVRNIHDALAARTHP